MATNYKDYLGGKDIKWWDGITRTFSRRTSTGGTLELNKFGNCVDVVEVYGSGTDYSATSINAALTAIGSRNCAIVLQPGTWTIGAAVTVPANVSLIAPRGAMLTKSGTGTITINGSFDAGLYQVFSGFASGNVTFGSGSVKEVYPQWWGAGIDTINNAVGSIKSNTHGGVVALSPGRYEVTSIDASSSTAIWDRTLVIRGAGSGAAGATGASTIVGTANGKVIIDAIGTNNIRLEQLTITTDSGIIAQTGLLLARSSTSQNCSRSRIRDVNIEGNFSLASHVAIAAESTVYDGVRFSNSNATADYTTFWTGTDNTIGVSSDHGAIYAGSNTDNRMYSPEFYAPYNNANVAVFYGAAGYSIYSPFFVTGNATAGRLITLQTQTGTGIFKGTPLAIYSPLFEGSNPTALYLQGDVAGYNYFNNLTIDGGYFNIFTAGAYSIVDTNASNNAVLNNWDIRNPRFNDTTPPLFSIFAILYSKIDLWNQTLAGTITIVSSQTGCILRANVVNEAYNAGTVGVYYATSVPVSGTYAVGSRVWNIAPAVGQPRSWVCTVAGTPGTWVSEGNL